MFRSNSIILDSSAADRPRERRESKTSCVWGITHNVLLPQNIAVADDPRTDDGAAQKPLARLPLSARQGSSCRTSG